MDSCCCGTGIRRPTMVDFGLIRYLQSCNGTPLCGILWYYATHNFIHNYIFSVTHNRFISQNFTYLQYFTKSKLKLQLPSTIVDMWATRPWIIGPNYFTRRISGEDTAAPQWPLLKRFKRRPPVAVAAAVIRVLPCPDGTRGFLMWFTVGGGGGETAVHDGRKQQHEQGGVVRSGRRREGHSNWRSKGTRYRVV